MSPETLQSIQTAREVFVGSVQFLKIGGILLGIFSLARLNQLFNSGNLLRELRNRTAGKLLFYTDL